MATAAHESCYIVPSFGKDLIIWATSAAAARAKAAQPFAEPVVTAPLATPAATAFGGTPKRAARTRETSATK